MKKLPGFVFCVLFLILTSCACSGAKLDAGLFTRKPCGPPCWNNLTPGQSLSGDVEQFIQGLNPREWPERRDMTYKSGCKSILIYSKTDDQISPFWDSQTYVLRFDVDNQELMFIESEHPGMPNLKQIVDQLGPPEYIEALNIFGPEQAIYMLEVYYPKQGLALKVLPDQKDTGWIKPEMQVQYLQYFPPGDLLSYFTLRSSCNLGTDGATKHAQMEIAKYVQPWPGFGKVQPIQTH